MLNNIKLLVIYIRLRFLRHRKFMLPSSTVNHSNLNDFGVNINYFYDGDAISSPKQLHDFSQKIGTIKNFDDEL